MADAALMPNITQRQDAAAASVLARCAGQVAKDAPQRKSYCDQAMKYLERAVQAGFRDAKSLMAEEWQPLRNRDDFRACWRS